MNLVVRRLKVLRPPRIFRHPDVYRTLFLAGAGLSAPTSDTRMINNTGCKLWWGDVPLMQGTIRIRASARTEAEAGGTLGSLICGALLIISKQRPRGGNYKRERRGREG